MNNLSGNLAALSNAQKCNSPCVQFTCSPPRTRSTQAPVINNGIKLGNVGKKSPHLISKGKLLEVPDSKHGLEIQKGQFGLWMSGEDGGGRT